MNGAISVLEFCKMHAISRAHFYNLLKRGEGPVLMRVGRRRLVSNEAMIEWRRRMEELAPGANEQQKQLSSATRAGQ